MTTNGWAQIALYFLLVIVLAKPMGMYITRVFDRRRTCSTPCWCRWNAPSTGSQAFRPMKRCAGRNISVSMLVFTAATVLLTYVIERLQGHLPWNPQHLPAVAPDLAWNTAISFSTNTNWQAYVPETTMSYLTQMLGLATHNFWSAAVGLALAIAFIRGITRRESNTLGNFWVDLTRGTFWILLPISAVFAMCWFPRESSRTFIHTPLQTSSKHSRRRPPMQPAKATTVVVTTQTIAQGPTASQEAIKMLGTNGGGFFNANSAHPFENPTPLSNFLQMLSIFLIPAGLTVTLGEMSKSPRHGWAVFAAMAVLSFGGVLACYAAEAQPNPLLHGVDQRTSAQQSGGNMEGKEVRFGLAKLRALCDSYHRCKLRRRQLHARLVHAARRHGALGQHFVGGNCLRRCWRGHVRHVDLRYPLRLHRRPHGRSNAGVSRQEDRSLRHQDGHALSADLSTGHPCLRGDRNSVTDLWSFQSRQPGTAWALGNPLRLCVSRRQ